MDTFDTDRISGMHDAPCGVSNHRAAETLAPTLLPGSFSPQGFPQSLIGLRRRVQAGQELGIGFGGGREIGAIKQGVFGRATGGVEHEVGAVLA